MAAADIAPGAVLAGEAGSRYVLRAQMHEGPRSTVWLADRLDDGQAVAVKLAPPRRAVAAAHEAGTMRALTACAEAAGPAGFAAPLLDAFELRRPQGGVGSGACSQALVTPLYGPSAATVVRGLAAERGRGLPRRAVRRMARGLLRALAHLHGPGHRLAHLDVKPHNLVVEMPSQQQQQQQQQQRSRESGNNNGGGGGGEEDARGPPRPPPPPPTSPTTAAPPTPKKTERWRLVDFGNASPLVRRGPWPLAHLPGWLPAPWGWRAARLPEYATPAYEAPESVLRLEGCPAAPADVWALGCCLCECATGWPLFRPLLVRGRLAIDDDDGDDENDGDTGGDEDEAGGGGGDGRKRWRVFSTAAEARLLSAIRATLGGPAPARLLRRSPVWRDYYDARGEPLDDAGTGGPPSRALARRPGSQGLRGRRLEDRLRASLGGSAEWGPERAAAFARFLRPMLAFDPEQRATAEAMLAHEWLVSSDGGDDRGEEEEEEDWGDGGRRPGGLRIEELSSEDPA